MVCIYFRFAVYVWFEYENINKNIVRIHYTVAEVLELAGNAAKDHKKKTIGPRHVMLGMLVCLQ